MQYLYDSGDAAVFMDNRDYEQIEIPRDVAGDAMHWVLPNAEVEVLFVDERPGGVQVPSAVDMAVTETEPGVKGDTASGGGTKPATLESGVRSRCRCSSRRARGSGSTPAAASTSRGPRLRTGSMRRSDQRRDAVFACYQRDVTGRPLEELARRREAVHPRAGRGRRGAPRRARRRDRPARARAGTLDRIAPLERNIMRVALYEIATATTSRPRSRSTRRSSSPRSTAAPTRPGSSTASSARREGRAAERSPRRQRRGDVPLPAMSSTEQLAERLREIAARLRDAELRRARRPRARPRGGGARRQGERGDRERRCGEVAAREGPVSTYPDDLRELVDDVPRGAPLLGRRRRPRASRRRCATRCSPAASGSARCWRWPRPARSAPSPSRCCRPPRRSS